MNQFKDDNKILFNVGDGSLAQYDPAIKAVTTLYKRDSLDLTYSDNAHFINDHEIVGLVSKGKYEGTNGIDDIIYSYAEVAILNLNTGKFT